MSNLYRKQLFGTDGFVILTEGANPGHLKRLDDKGVFPRDYADLFCAAPELLEALKKSRKALATAIIAHSGGMFDDETVGEHPVVAQADAAIAKATGA